MTFRSCLLDVPQAIRRRRKVSNPAPQSAAGANVQVSWALLRSLSFSLLHLHHFHTSVLTFPRALVRIAFVRPDAHTWRSRTLHMREHLAYGVRSFGWSNQSALVCDTIVVWCRMAGDRIADATLNSHCKQAPRYGALPVVRCLLGKHPVCRGVCNVCKCLAGGAEDRLN